MAIADSMNQTATSIPWTQVQLRWKLTQEPELKLSMQIHTQEEAVVVRCTGRVIYGDEAAALFRKIVEVLPQARHVVLELSQVEVIDGAGLGELLASRARAQQEGCTMTLAAPRKLVRELLEITHLSEVFGVYPTAEAAIDSSRAHAV